MRRAGLLALLLSFLPWTLASAGATTSADAEPPRAFLHIEIDLALAPTGTTPYIFDLADHSASTLLNPTFIHENSRYCIEPYELVGECLLPPHSLVLQLGLGNLTEDRILETSYRLMAPRLELLESRGPWRVPDEGFYEPFTKFRYALASNAVESHEIVVGVLQPRESRRVNVLITFPEPQRAPDHLTLEFVATARPVPVEEVEALGRIAFQADQELTVPPRGDAPGVHLSAYAAGETGGSIEIAEVSSPGLLAGLEALPGLRRAAPLYRFRALGVRSQFEARFPPTLLAVPEDAGAICAASFSGGQWFLSPVERLESGLLKLHISNRRYVDDAYAGPRDKFITLVQGTGPGNASEVCR